MIVEDWRLEDKTCQVWGKEGRGTGYSVIDNAEILIVRPDHLQINAIGHSRVLLGLRVRRSGPMDPAAARHACLFTGSLQDQRQLLGI